MSTVPSTDVLIGDTVKHKSNQIKSYLIKLNQIKSNVGFCGEGKTGVPGEKPLGAK